MSDPGARTWTLTLRGDPSGTIAHEYLCPEHGRFTVEVPRADVPDEVACPHVYWTSPPVDSSFTRTEYCGATSHWSPSGIASRVKPGEVVRGKVETAGLPDHVCMSTQALADGMPLHEFKAQRAKLHQDLALNKMRQLTGKARKVFR